MHCRRNIESVYYVILFTWKRCRRCTELEYGDICTIHGQLRRANQMTIIYKLQYKPCSVNVAMKGVFKISPTVVSNYVVRMNIFRIGQLLPLNFYGYNFIPNVGHFSPVGICSIPRSMLRATYNQTVSSKNNFYTKGSQIAIFWKSSIRLGDVFYECHLIGQSIDNCAFNNLNPFQYI